MTSLKMALSVITDYIKANPLWICAVGVATLVFLPSYILAAGGVIALLSSSILLHHMIRDVESYPNLIPQLNRTKKETRTRSPVNELTLLKKICPVCGKEKCKRHRPEINFVAIQPWTNVEIPEKVNNALEELFNLILKEHVFTWYKEISEDDAFVDEIRASIKFVTAIAVRRLAKVDIPTIIQTKILRTILRHLHFYLEVKKKVSPGADIEQAVLDQYGRHLHVAVRNRKAELEYHRNLVERLFPHVLPHHSLQCKSLCVLLREILSAAVILPAMDVLADPDIVNNILLLLFDGSPAPECNDPPSPLVPVLGTFTNKTHSNKVSCLHLELNDILTNPDTLFPFMNFLKAEAAVNVLNFYLTVEDFSKQILLPEINEKERNHLHEELQQLYRMYINPVAVDTIRFDEDIVTQLQAICDGPPEGVIKLQTTTPLFRAHDHAYDLLQHTFLPLFHQSDNYYELLCGERKGSTLSRSDSNPDINNLLNVSATTRVTKRVDSIKSKIGSKIKGVFKTPTVDGKLIDGIDYAVEEGEKLMDSDGSQDELPAGYRSVQYKIWEDGPLRDLSAWRLAIPKVVTKPDPENSKRTVHLFVIEVRRVDVLENDFEASKWEVHRRYNEFYVLDQKLTEFHGEIEDAVLPAKKTFGKTPEFYEAKRIAFQDYMQTLLTMPTLRGSELLYSFLTSQLEFASSFLPDINIGKMMKSGAMKLVKERGQHLEPFLDSYLKSADSLKALPSRWSDKDSDTVSISSEKMYNSLYDNNADKEIQLTCNTPLHINLNSIDYVPCEGAYDMIMYLADHVYKTPRWLHDLLLSLRIVCRGTLDSLFDWFLGKKIDHLSQDYRTEAIIHLIRDVLFFDTDPPRTDEQKGQRKNEAYKALKSIYPSLFIRAMGTERFEQGTSIMFEALQKPRLNKQLSYMLLDEVLKEAFPEILTETQPHCHPFISCKTKPFM